jgi:Mn2+/Fe2+ NRAMP family transporter
MRSVAALALFCTLLGAATPALAYMGPGAGLGMLGSLFALIGAVLVGLFGLVVLPVRMLMKRLRKPARPLPVEPR